MARYTGSVCRLCRREGTKLFLKGDRCLSGKCALEKRPNVPGQHGAGRKNVKEYGLQLREKQKAKRYYGVLESQFKGYFEKADKTEGVTGENLLSLLERRLDNVVYRIGLADSRKEAASGQAPMRAQRRCAAAARRKTRADSACRPLRAGQRRA